MTSQEVIQKEVLDVPDPVLDEIRRVFVHCIVIKHPSQVHIKTTHHDQWRNYGGGPGGDDPPHSHHFPPCPPPPFILNYEQ